MSKASGSERRQLQRSVAVRLLPDEARALDDAAEKAGMSVAAYVRTVALGRAGPRAVRRPPVEKAELARILIALGRIGGNINQIAKVANSTGIAASDSELTAMRADLLAMRNTIMGLVHHRP